MIFETRAFSLFLNPNQDGLHRLPGLQLPIFDPSQRLVGDVPTINVPMKDLGLSKDSRVSPVAVSHPFQLFTSAAVDIMRKEIFSVPD